MPRGRPVKSEIRKNIIEILFTIGPSYGYRIHKVYNQIFAPCTNEVVYYHLRKGVVLGEFKLQEIKKEKGDFSWGSVVEKKIYTLGPKAKPAGNKQVKEYVEKTKKP